MPALFLDASGWFAALVPTQRGHELARATYADAARAGRGLVTTAFVIAEVHALLLRWRDARAGRRFLDVALDATAHTVVAPDHELIAESLRRWIHGYVDQTFSLCDAISFEVMRRERLTRALTYDRHFAAAGFETLPSNPP